MKSGTIKTDQEILEEILVVETRDKALAFLYKECRPMARQMGFKFKLTTDDSDDVLQEAVIAIWKKVVQGHFILTVKLTTYIGEICKNLFMKKTRREPNVPLPENAADLPDSDDGNDSELFSIVYAHLEMLESECRHLIIGFYSGATMQSLAAQFGYSSTSNATVKKHRCIEKLRKLVTSQVNSIIA